MILATQQVLLFRSSAVWVFLWDSTISFNIFILMYFRYEQIIKLDYKEQRGGGSPSAMNSLSTNCIVLTTCFSSSLSCIHTRCQQSPPAPPRSHQDCTWAVMVSKIAELLPSCSPAWSTSPPCPPPMWLGFTSSPALPRLSNETMHFQCMGGHNLVHTVFYSNYLI